MILPSYLLWIFLAAVFGIELVLRMRLNRYSKEGGTWRTRWSGAIVDPRVWTSEGNSVRRRYNAISLVLFMIWLAIALFCKWV